MAKGMAGDFGDHAGHQTEDSFGKQALNIAPNILDFVENTLDAFARAG